MRILVAIAVCALLGGLAFEETGAAVGLVFGLVIGLLWHGRAKQPKEADAAAIGSAAGDPMPPALTVDQRVAALEARVVRLERAVAGSSAADIETIRQGIGAQPVPGTAGELPASMDAAASPLASLSATADALHGSAEPTVEGVADASAAMTITGPQADDADTRPAGAASTEPTKPSLIHRFLSGNVVAKIGTIIVFFGVAFAIKFALENAMVPVEAWFALAALFAIVLLGIGWKLRRNETGYGLILQGGGVGILYLVTFGALKLYQLLPPSMAFAILVALTVLSAILALLQDSMSLAAIGVTGGFLAPILASSGGGSHVGLFTYYAILNAGIVLIAWFKAWRVLNVLGFAFTVIIGCAWGAQFYAPALFATTEPFLILFFAMYIGIAILFAARQAPRLTHYVDGTIVFGTPIATFGMQAALVYRIDYALAFTALGMGIVYVVLASVLHARHKESLRLLVESFFALALIFGTLAIPMAVDPQWTSAAWAVEGAAVLWAGIRQRRVLARVFGGLVQLGGALMFLSQLGQMGSGHWIFVNSSGLGMTMVALAALFTALQLDRHADRLTAAERQLSGLVFGWGCLWWLAMGIHEIDDHVSDRWLPTAGLAFLGVSGIAFSVASTKLAWPIARWPALMLLPFYLLLALMSPGHPLAAGGWAAWPIALVVHYWLLYRHDRDPDIGRFGRAWLGAVHGASLLLIALLAAWELHWWPDRYGLEHSAWTVAAPMIVPALLLALVSRAGTARWPMSVYRDHYLLRAGSVLAIALVCWMWFANATHDGSSEPLPYLPILNALDLGHLLAILAIAMWWLRLRELGVPIAAAGGSKAVRIVAGLTLFVWLNAILLRTLHHWFAIPYDIDPLWESRVVQASLSIFWTVIAFVLMLIAHRQRQRLMWTIGAGLMGVVVAKLFLADLSNLSGIVRIVAFLGVGVLMVLMGYFVPLPPKAAAPAASIA